MSQVNDVTLNNQGFSAFRTELNNILGALNSMHSGTSRPSSATTGTIWLDTTNSGSNSLELKFFDGSDDITFATVNTSANTINFSDSATDVVGDTTPQLGGNLDCIVNNAGINRDITFSRMSQEEWQEVIDTNLGALFNMSKACVPHMRDNNFGSIVSISSIIGETGNICNWKYKSYCN